MNFILNVLTLGMLPLYRMLSPSEEDPRRGWRAIMYFEQFGNPPAERLAKALRKFFKGEELECSLRLLTTQNVVFVRTEKEGEELIERVEKLGFNLRDDEVYPLDEDHMYWNKERSQYTPVNKLNYCGACQRKSVRLYWSWEDECHVCSSCGSSDVINAEGLSSKEFINHAKRFESLPAHSPAKGRSSSSEATSSTRW